MPEIILYAVMAAAIGVIVCFWGKKLYFPIIMLSAFWMALTTFVERFGLAWQTILLGCAIGAGAAMLARFAYQLGVFLLGAMCGGILGVLFTGLLPESAGTAKWWIKAACALIIGFCAVKWRDIFIVLGTALQGGAMFAGSAVFLLLNGGRLREFVYVDGALSTITHLRAYLEQDLMAQNPFLLIGVMLAAALAGTVFQLSQAQREFD